MEIEKWHSGFVVIDERVYMMGVRNNDMAGTLQQILQVLNACQTSETTNYWPLKKRYFFEAKWPTAGNKCQDCTVQNASAYQSYMYKILYARERWEKLGR